ncbi:phage major capsid protein [Ovoidimarina sediminis]|uniref:phage major capsid protein n=1 Tax=Ovoidimarina sediminis TaxID=3079856 RepID=UPI003977B680
MPDVGANAHPIPFGDFAQSYPVADAGGIRVTLNCSISMPGRLEWHIRRRVGGIVADQRAVCAAECAVS